MLKGGSETKGDVAQLGMAGSRCPQSRELGSGSQDVAAKMGKPGSGSQDLEARMWKPGARKNDSRKRFVDKGSSR